MIGDELAWVADTREPIVIRRDKNQNQARVKSPAHLVASSNQLSMFKYREEKIAAYECIDLALI
jgi:hypothetical protein